MPARMPAASAASCSLVSCSTSRSESTGPAYRRLCDSKSRWIACSTLDEVRSGLLLPPGGVGTAAIFAPAGPLDRASVMSFNPTTASRSNWPATRGSIACASGVSALGSMPAPRQKACTAERRSDHVEAWW